MAISVGSTLPQLIAEVTIDAAQVNATSELDVTATVSGLTTDMMVDVNWPSLEASLGIMNKEVSATDTLKIRLRNFSASGVNPASKAVKVIAF